MFNKIFNKAVVVIFMILFIVFLAKLGQVINELGDINTSILKLQRELSYTSTSTSIPSNIDVRIIDMPTTDVRILGTTYVNSIPGFRVEVENRVGDSFKIKTSQW